MARPSSAEPPAERSRTPDVPGVLLEQFDELPPVADFDVAGDFEVGLPALRTVEVDDRELGGRRLSGEDRQRRETGENEGRQGLHGFVAPKWTTP
jgi:hypothetical protein